MTNEQRPLIPVNPHGLEDIARALLADSPPGAEGNVMPGELPEIVRRNPRDYIRVPQYNLVIAKAETHKGKNMFDTLEALTSERLFMPSPTEFIVHWMNVKKGADGLNVVQYADGSHLSKAEVDDLWKYMSSGHRGGCWTWLNARFREGQGVVYMENNLQVSKDAQNKRILVPRGGLKPIPPSQRVNEDCYVDLNFNNDGLPVNKSAQQKYVQGQNIYFYYPRNNRVAGFGAYSGRADLSCLEDPSGVNPRLGVLACAAGGAPKK